MRTITERPLAGLVTRRRVPKGRDLWAAVEACLSKRSPEAVGRPWKGSPYQEAVQVAPPCGVAQAASARRRKRRVWRRQNPGRLTGGGSVGGAGGGAGEEGGAGGGAEAVGAGGNHGLGGGMVFDAARGFDAHVGADGFAHEADGLDGGAAGAESGGGFDEGGAGFLDGAAGGGDFFGGEEAGFEDDFDDVAAGGGDDFVDFVLDEIPVAFLGRAEVHDHIEFIGAGFEGIDGGVHFGLGEGGPKGEADDGADFDGGAGEEFFAIGDPVGVDADGEKGVGAGFLAMAADVSEGGVGAEEGVIDESGEVHVGRIEPAEGRLGKGERRSGFDRGSEAVMMGA